jgi:hypothetical protein
LSGVDERLLQPVHPAKDKEAVMIVSNSLTTARAGRETVHTSETPEPGLRLRGRERFWRELELYLEFWAIAREPVVAAAAPRKAP